MYCIRNQLLKTFRAGTRYCSSRSKLKHHPLFVPRDRQEKVVQLVKPDLDLTNFTELRKNLQLRGCYDSQVDFDRLNDDVERYYRVEEQVSASVKVMQEMKKAQEDSSHIGEQVRKLKEELAKLEESVCSRVVELPNELDKECPEKDDLVILSHGEWPERPPSGEFRSHVELAGDELEFNSFVNPTDPAFYLLGNLAMLEMEILERAQRHLHDSNFFMLANPDMVMSVGVEGCGVDFTDSAATFCLEKTSEHGERAEGQAMHVVGGASIFPFVCFFSKNILVNATKRLPRSYYCLGRRYLPVSQCQLKESLFYTQQTSAVEFFNLSSFDTDQKGLLDGISSTVAEFYSNKIGLSHFRLVIRSAPKLARAESLRICVEAPAPSLGSNAYMEVGNVCLYGDYLSKRMMLKESTKSKLGKQVEELRNLRVIGGTLVDSVKLIGCLLESSQVSSSQFRLK